MKKINLAPIIFFYNTLLNHQEKGKTELIVMPVNHGRSDYAHCKSFYVTNQQDFCTVVQHFYGTHNIYCGGNPRPYDLQLPAKQADIEWLTRIALDIDVIRKENHPATESEVNAALAVAQAIKTDFQSAQIYMTGNGACLWFQIHPYQLPTDPVQRQHVYKACTQIESFFRHNYLDDKRSHHIEIDAVSKFSDLNKVVGTPSLKGIPTPERPHRMATMVASDGIAISFESLLSAMAIDKRSPK